MTNGGTMANTVDELYQAINRLERRRAGASAALSDTGGLQNRTCLHIPAILHRTGGPSADLKNVCARCGDVIYRDGDRWSIHPPLPACAKCARVFTSAAQYRLRG